MTTLVSPPSAGRLVSFAAFACIGLVLPEPATAQETAPTVHRSPHMEHTANLVGLKASFVSVFKEGESAVGGGFSPFYERNVIPGWLEIESAMAFTWVEEDTVVAFDLFFKKPFHVSETINPYVGLGPHLAIIIFPEGTRTRGGINASAGSYFWFGKDRWGLDAEVVYTLLFDSGPLHELHVEAGPTFRF